MVYRLRMVTFLFSLFVVYSSSATPLAYGPTSLGLAGSGRAGLDSSEAVFLNPALVGLVDENQGQILYLDGTPSPGVQHTEMGVTLVDGGSSDAVSNGALSYRKLRRLRTDGELWHMGFGKLVTPKFAFGFSGYWLKYDDPLRSIGDQWNLSVGTLYLINTNLGVAYVLDSPLEVKDSVPDAFKEVLTHSVGMFYKLTEISRFRLDVSRQEKLNPDKELDVSASLEVMTSQYIKFRLGQAWDWRQDANWVGAGLAFMGPRLEMTYGMRKSWKGRGALHSVDLRIPF